MSLLVKYIIIFINSCLVLFCLHFIKNSFVIQVADYQVFIMFFLSNIIAPKTAIIKAA